jgi:ESS family glutamate:Na+ symporter
MLPINDVSGTILDSVFIYMSVIGMLLLVATIIRLKIPFFKKIYMPASLLAGIIGLILGPHFIGLIPSQMTSMFSAISGRLIVLVYAPILMRKVKTNKKEVAVLVGTRTTYCYFLCFAQYAIPLLLSMFLFSDINPLFATIVEQGWAGGHGTAGGMAVVFEELGWLDGQSLSVTSATFGLITGVVGGAILINIGVRKGWCAYLKQDSKGMENTDPEIYNADNTRPSAMHVTSSNVIDSFSFHLALISVAIFLGWLLNKGIYKLVGFSMSWFVTAMFCGLFIKLCIKNTKFYDAIDNNIINRIQGVSLDFLIVGAIASVNIPVVMNYLTPLLIQQLLVLIFMVWAAVWLAPRIINKDWFEHNIATFGTYTGVAAVGLLLLRMADPDLKSNVLDVGAAISPFTTWAIGGGVITSTMPSLIVKYGITPVTMVCCAGTLITFLILRIFFWNGAGIPKDAASRND